MPTILRILECIGLILILSNPRGIHVRSHFSASNQYPRPGRLRMRDLKRKASHQPKNHWKIRKKDPKFNTISNEFYNGTFHTHLLPLARSWIRNKSVGHFTNTPKSIDAGLDTSDRTKKKNPNRKP